MDSANFLQVLNKDGTPYVGRPVQGYYTGGSIQVDKSEMERIRRDFNVTLEPNQQIDDNVDPKIVEFTPQKEWWDSPPVDNEKWDFNKKTYDWGKYPCDNFPNEDFEGETRNWRNYRNKNLKEIDEKKKKIKELELQLKVLKLETENAELREYKSALKRESKYYKKMNEIFSKKDKKEFDKQKKERDFYAMP